jgi:hypothetical protein
MINLQLVAKMTMIALQLKHAITESVKTHACIKHVEKMLYATRNFTALTVPVWKIT